MILAAIDWLSISINLLLVIFVVVCLLMTLLILMQRPKQEGLGAAFGGGVTDQVFGARTTNVLQRGTVYLGSLFFIISLTLAVLIGHKNKKTSMLEDKKAPAAEVKDAKETKPDASSQPKSLSEELSVEETPPTGTPAETPAPVQVPAPTHETPVPTPAPQPAPQPAPEPAPADGSAATPPVAAPGEAPKPADATAPTGEPPAAPEEKSGQP